MATGSTSYSDWLDAYSIKLGEMTPEQIAKENHQDERHPSQTYADYLDYVDEWKWYHQQQVQELTRATIYTYSRRNQRLKCGNHYHTLSLSKEESDPDTIFTDEERAPHTRCWYKTIRTQVEEILSQLTTAKVRLADPLEIALTRIATWRLVDSGTTPTLLPLDVFTAIWWQADAHGGEKRVAQQLLERLQEHDREFISRLRHIQSTEAQPPKEGVLLWYPESDHGVHALRKAMAENDFRELLRFVNKARKRRGETRHITYQDIIRKEAKCKHCSARKTPRKLSTRGIYFAPPGFGKTTALNEELLVGFDTDWIGRGVTWRELSPLLTAEIPIITNQHAGFIGSGLKVHGAFHTDVRLDVRGIPFTTKEQLRAVQATQPKNLDFEEEKDEVYFADVALKLQIKQILQLLIADYSVNKRPFYELPEDAEWTRKWTRLIRDERYPHVT